MIYKVSRAIFVTFIFVAIVFYFFGKNFLNKKSKEEKIVELYIASFNRAPTNLGLKYWLSEIKKNKYSIEHIASIMFQQKEIQELYPSSMPMDDFIKRVYQNLFNREPAFEEIFYWRGELLSGNISKELFIIAIINGIKESENKNYDKKIFSNKVKIGLYFAIKKEKNNLKLSKDIIKLITKDENSIDIAKAKIDEDNLEKSEIGNYFFATIPYAIVDTNQNKNQIKNKFYIDNFPSYINNNDGTISDNITNLQWQETPKEIEVDNVFIYCEDLFLGGYSDWRVPNIKTIYSLANFDKKDLKINQKFFKYPTKDIKLASASLWEENLSTKAIMLTFDIKTANINQMEIDFYGDKNKTHVQCVRGNENYGYNDFIIDKIETISDNATKLMWQKNHSKELLSFSEAIKYCENLKIEDYNDWRVPTIKELQSIVDYNSLNAKSIKGSYWSSTKLTSVKEHLYLNFDNILANETSNQKNLVKCVRNMELFN